MGAGGTKDHTNMITPGAVDGIPETANLLGRHPVLRIQQDHRVDLARRKAIEKLPQTGADRNDQTCVVAHSRKMPPLQIGRQAAVSWAGIAMMQRLPGKIIAVVGLPVDEA